MRLLFTSSNKLLKFLQQRGNYVCKIRHRQKRGGVFPMPQSVLEAIYARRSIREFTHQDVALSDLHEIVRAGIWAPSGLNNQPWRFVLVTDAETRKKLSETTHYSHIVLAARALIAVYLDTEAMYDAVKDHQAAGACIENMLLAAEALGLGAVWLGQILKNKDKVNKILDLSSQYDLMAVLAIGHPLHRNQKSSRKGLDVFILKTF
jgi:nitroreductase